MGTHNALLRLGERVYLEIIAIDPDGAMPPRPRWFDLDDIALQSELTERPQLVEWVARTADIERSAAACAVPLGAVTPMQRGDYRWRITIPDDGRRPGKGILPTLIQWDVPTHPADGLPPSRRLDRAGRRGARRSGAPSRGARRARSRRCRADHLRPRRAPRGDAAYAARTPDALGERSHASAPARRDRPQAFDPRSAHADDPVVEIDRRIAMTRDQPQRSPGTGGSRSGATVSTPCSSDALTYSRPRRRDLRQPGVECEGLQSRIDDRAVAHRRAHHRGEHVQALLEMMLAGASALRW